MIFDVKNRMVMMFLIEVINGNLNGDPDQNGEPRQDEFNDLGIVSASKLPRMIKDTAKIIDPSINLFVEPKCFLNDKLEKVKSPEEMLKIYWDCRATGFVGSTGSKKGQSKYAIQGPIHIPVFNSIHPIRIVNMGISRCCQTEKSTDKVDKKTKEPIERSEDHGTFGDYNYVPYGVYCGHVYFSPEHAKRTGFDEDDMKLFLKSMAMMFELDQSYMRGTVNLRKLWIFNYPTPLGGAMSPQQLFSSTQVKVKDGVDCEELSSWDQIEINESKIDSSIKKHELIEKDRKLIL